MSAAVTEALVRASEIDKKIKEFFDAINTVLDWVPGFLDHLIEPIRAGIEKLNQKIREFWNKVQEFLDNTGDPDKLERYAEEWRNQVGNPIGSIAGRLSKENLETNTEWTGSGAEAYKAVLPAQEDGLNGMKEISIQFSKTFKDLANGIEDFWIAIGIAFGSAIIGFGVAIVEAATVVAIPGAIVTAIGAIGVAFGFITKAIVELKGIYDTIDTSQIAIEQGLTDLGDKWAEAKPVNQNKINDEQQWETI